jgi:hypothetical protein
MIARLSVLLTASAALMGAQLPSPAAASVLNQWVQYGDGVVLVRTISSPGDSCPSLTVDNSPIAMTQRYTPDVVTGTVPPGATVPPGSTLFPVVMCEASMPLNFTQHTATINGTTTLKMPIANPKRILIIGDTGCRSNTGQACNSPAAFPLAYLSTYASRFKPDMIVHTGDFYYREGPCPAGNSGCAGSPYGQNWDAWNADWFAPSIPLQLAAPMALTRGNHESCDRGQNGWFHLLDVHPYNAYDVNGVSAAYCPRPSFTSYRSVTTAKPEPSPRDPADTTPAYIAPAGPLSFLMFDVSYANDGIEQPNLQAQYAADVNTAISKLNGTQAVFTTHKPVYGLNTSSVKSGVAGGGNVNEQTLFGQSVSPSISLFLSGHTHNYEVVDMANPNLAPQLVIGNSGTLLDGQQVCFTATGCPSGVPVIAQNASFAVQTSAGMVSTFATNLLQDANQFGFAVLDQVSPNSYVANVYNLNSTKAGRCVITLTPRSITCGS